MRRRRWIAALVVGIAGFVAMQSCASREVLTSQVDQEADGCGAYRYRGSANIDCRYKGSLSYGYEVSGTCLNDSQIKCTYAASCTFALEQVITECVSQAPDCMSACPPEASDPTINTEFTNNLAPGSTLCDPPADAVTLRNYCVDYPRYQNAHAAMRNECEANTDRNMCGATCCLNCPNPTPLPGPGVAEGAFAGDGYGSCSGEDN